MSQETESVKINLADVKVGNDVQERMIDGETDSFETGSKVFIWLKVENGTGQTVTIIWKQNDYADKYELSMGGSPWRTWAYKTVHKAGDWTVTVTDGQGNVLKELSFTVK